MRKKKWNGCDEDCGNCSYPDCYKPAKEIRATKETATVREKEHPTSQQRMYTLCLGGYGGTGPNASKKFMF